MFKFFKKLQRKENLKLINSCGSIARQLQGLQFFFTYDTTNSETQQLFEFLANTIEELEQIKLWLENNDVLPASKSNELLNLHKLLSAKLKEIESGRK